MSYSYDRRRGFGTSGPRFNIKKPVEVDKEYEANIEDTSRRGDGVAKIGGFIVFIPNTKQGDHVKFKITRVGRRFAIGESVGDDSQSLESNMRRTEVSFHVPKSNV